MQRYQLIERIGAGGMGDVWLAHRALGDESQQVAVKFICERDAHKRDALERLQREARVCMALHHTNIVKVLDLVNIDGRPALVMEHVQGVTLGQLSRSVELSGAVMRRIMQDALAGLRHAHAQGIWHRDISPHNIMVTRDGVARIVDFGIARDTSEPATIGAAKGTVPYMAPEVIEHHRWSPGSDIYGLGAVCYEALTGAPPFGAGDRMAVLRCMEQGGPAPLPATVPDDIRAFIAFALGDVGRHSKTGIAFACEQFMQGAAATHVDVGLAVRSVNDKHSLEHADTRVLGDTRESLDDPGPVEHDTDVQADIATGAPVAPMPTATRRRWWPAALAVAAMALGLVLGDRLRAPDPGVDVAEVTMPAPVPVPGPMPLDVTTPPPADIEPTPPAPVRSTPRPVPARQQPRAVLRDRTPASGKRAWFDGFHDPAKTYRPIRESQQSHFHLVDEPASAAPLL